MFVRQVKKKGAAAEAAIKKKEDAAMKKKKDAAAAEEAAIKEEEKALRKKAVAEDAKKAKEAPLTVKIEGACITIPRQKLKIESCGNPLEGSATHASGTPPSALQNVEWTWQDLTRDPIGVRFQDGRPCPP